MVILSRLALGRDADTALDAYLHAKIVAWPGRIRGAPLPSVTAPAARRDFLRRHPLRVRRFFAARNWRRHGARQARASLN